jgi:hypothetical protein
MGRKGGNHSGGVLSLGPYRKGVTSSPSMRRPVSAKSVFFPRPVGGSAFEPSCSVAILASALSLNDFRSLQVGRIRLAGAAIR